jgi:predicted dithiol-disulfide oxidoreductase (DUF899 family)
MHTIRFPGETEQYRAARTALLDAEMALRRQLAQVAEQRSRLPLGGALRQDYVFEDGSADIDAVDTARQTRLSELFGANRDTLIVYSFMYGPEMKQACTSCTSILDGLNGTAPHVMQRVPLVVVAKSPLERIRRFARERRWRNLRLLSSAKNSYNADYHGENRNGDQLPALNVFVRRNGQIHHFYNTELLYVKPEPGQDGRHVDLIWPLWNLFDYTPEGRGTDWYPELAYD